jgi:uncharacterized protein YwgA
MKPDYNKQIMLELIEKQQWLGKTAVMKIMFILQYIYNIELGYKFNIYTYGPYASEVTEDLDALILQDYVDPGQYEYLGRKAYDLTISENGKRVKESIKPAHKLLIATALGLFGKKTAKELELDTTLIYTKHQYNRNKWGDDSNEIVNNVHEMKPHFNRNEIEKALETLTKQGIFKY